MTTSMADTAATTPTDGVDWIVDVTEPMPDVKSCEAAYKVLASITEWKDWRSSDFAKFKVTLAEGVSEPLQTGDEYYIQMAPLVTTTGKVVESGRGDEENHYVFDIAVSPLFGLVHGRVRFTIFEKDGVVMGRAQEKQSGLLKLCFPSLTLSKGNIGPCSKNSTRPSRQSKTYPYLNGVS